MGLDIYKVKPIFPEDVESLKDNQSTIRLTLSIDEESNNRKEFFEKFNKYIVPITTIYCDIEKWFKDRNLDYNDYTVITQCFGDDALGGDSYIEIVNENDNEAIKIPYSEFEEIEVEEKAIYGIKTGYQRKGMTYDFYKKFYGSCWYINGDDTDIEGNDNIAFVWTKDKLKEMKQYAEKDTDILKWILGKNEFIYNSA